MTLPKLAIAIVQQLCMLCSLQVSLAMLYIKESASYVNVIAQDDKFNPCELFVCSKQDKLKVLLNKILKVLISELG